MAAPNTQAPLVVAGGKRQVALLHQVSGGHQPNQAARLIYQRQLLHAMRGHRRRRLGFGGPAGEGHQPIARRHTAGHRRRQVVDKLQVALGEQSFEVPIAGNDHQGAHPRALHHRAGIGQRCLGRDGQRVGDDAVLRALDLHHLAHLRLDVARTEPTVDDADAALLGHDNRHLRTRDGVHVGRDDRTLQGQRRGESRRQIDRRGIAPVDDAHLRGQQEVVEGAPGHCGEQVHG